MRKYRTVQGDTFDLIAYRNYPQTGGEKNVSRLIGANPEYADYVIFPAGIALNLPDEEINTKGSTAPWRA